MIKAVIIEDEKYAALFLKDILNAVAPDIKVIAMLENISDSIRLLPLLHPDLIFADIQLEDGNSFFILKPTSSKAFICPRLRPGLMKEIPFTWA